jgi:hypothetical protein
LRVGCPVQPTEAASAHDLFEGVPGCDHVSHRKGACSVVAMSRHVASLSAGRTRNRSVEQQA